MVLDKLEEYDKHGIPAGDVCILAHYAKTIKERPDQAPWDPNDKKVMLEQMMSLLFAGHGKQDIQGQQYNDVILRCQTLYVRYNIVIDYLDFGVPLPTS